MIPGFLILSLLCVLLFSCALRVPFGLVTISLRRGSLLSYAILPGFCLLLLGTGLLPSAEAAAGAGSGAAVVFAGPLSVGTTSPSQSVQVTVQHAGTISAVRVLTQGTPNLDFTTDGTGTCTAGISYPAGQTCTVGVTFKPVYPGQRLGAVVVVDAAGAAMGTRALSGAGKGAIGAFVPGTMSTVAGDAAWLYSGDGNLATGSAIFLPFGVAVDSTGNMFIADSSNSRIRKVTAVTGLMSTIAGNGVVGSTGDGGSALQATLSNPTSIALDGAGNIYFADNGNNVVRRVSALDGTIATVAGVMGQHGYAGDGGQASAALLNTPNGIAFDASGNLFIADTSNHVIREVNAATGLISTVAGAGSPGFGGDGGPATAAFMNGPWSVTIAPDQTMYIADQYNQRIRKVSVAGTISTVVGNGQAGFDGDGGLATDAVLNIPAGVAIDVIGNLYVADSGNNRVRKVNAVTGMITSVAGNQGESISGDGGPATQAGLYGPYTLALDGLGSLYIADVFHNRIRKVSTSEALLNYPPMRVGRISTPQQQIFENDGNAPLTIASVIPESNSAIDAVSTTCLAGTILTPLTQCTIGAEFAPTELGTPTKGYISIASDAANGTAKLTLSGNVLSVDPATIAVTSNLNPAQAGTNITFSVVVSSSGTIPTGSVTLLDGTTALATANLQAGGIVSFNLNTLTGGTHNITATYAGDTNNTPASSAILVQVVKDLTAATTTNLTASANPSNAGAILRLIASVSITTAGSGTGAISGTVTFKEGSTTLGAGAITNGAATLSLATLTVGTHQIIASYGGSNGYGASASAPLAMLIKVSTSTLSLATSANPSVGNAPITLTATSASNGGSPTGPVQFFEGTTLLATGTLNAQGLVSVTLSTGALAVGSHQLTASYAGDANNAASVSNMLPQTVSLANTTTVVASSLNPSAQGAAVQLSAHITPNSGTASGLVQFFDGTMSLGSASINASGDASLSTATLALGLHSIAAVYAGDAFCAGSSSAALTETVNHAVATIALSTSLNPAAFGTGVTFRAQVQGTGSQPAGTATLLDGSVNLGTMTLDANSIGTLVLSNLGIGAHSLAAVYNGDTNHAAATSALVNQQILQVTATSLSGSPTNSIAGTPVRWTIQVSGASGTAVTGTVQLRDGASTLVTLPLDATGLASYSTSALAPGTHAMTAVYSGDTLNEPSTSAAVPELITIAATTTTLTTSANPAYTSAPVVLTAATGGNGGIPGGNIVFFDGANSLGSVPVSANGNAMLSVGTLAPGFHTLTAAYSGDTDDAPSVSTALQQQIVQKTVISLSTPANPARISSPLIVTATLTGGLVATPATGTVVLTDGGAPVGSATLSATGMATFTLSAPALGTHTLVASYSGDANSSAAASLPLLENVALWPTTNDFATSSSALSAGQQVTFVSVVQGGAARPPSGVVSFVSGSTVLGTATLSATGVASLTLSPQQANYNVIAKYPGDALYAASDSAQASIIVGPTTEFTLSMTPATITMPSGQHMTLGITIVSAATFTDTLALGCAGLPVDATCTFSINQIPLAGGVVKTLTVVVDTGDPLGAGAVARRDAMPLAGHSGVLACMLPGGALLALLLWRARRQSVRFAGLLLLALCASAMATGCASSLNISKTPAGSYAFRIVGTGNATGATQSGNVSLTVTK